jgi:Fe-S cluster assembly iron-binding protein IscA
LTLEIPSTKQKDKPLRVMVVDPGDTKHQKKKDKPLRVMVVDPGDTKYQTKKDILMKKTDWKKNKTYVKEYIDKWSAFRNGKTTSVV